MNFVSVHSGLKQAAFSVLAFAILSGCNLTPKSQETVQVSNQDDVKLAAPIHVDKPLTLKQIMADPDWMGILAKGAYWGDDSQSIYFTRQSHSSPIRDYYRQELNQVEAVKLDLAEYHLADQRNGQLSPNLQEKAYLYQGNLFVKNLTSGDITQLTKLNKAIEGIGFLANGDLVYWQSNSVFQLHRASGLVEQIADIQMTKAPADVKGPSSYIAKQQERLIQYVAKQYKDAQTSADHKANWAKVDPSMAAQAFYLGDSEVVTELSVSPSGKYILVSLRDKSYSWRNEHDIMPNYLGKEGYVDAVNARARVAEDNPPGERLVLLDLTDHKQMPITIEGLTGFDEDVLAKVKHENARAKGESYDSVKAVRKIQLMQDWGWGQSAIQWSEDGEGLIVMLEAVDNKDRWIASVNLTSAKLTTQHRLHDDAWINYTHNQFGILPNGEQFYYLSEESGYSQLYLQRLNDKPKALTQGQFVVSNVTLGPKAEYLYYKANKAHPGIENVYRVALQTGKSEQLTDWQGKLDYVLSPIGKLLLLTASMRTQPEELYLQTIGGELKQLTHYTSDTFKQYPWQAPEVVKVASTHDADGIYARVYLPQGFDKNKADKYPAVIFNHGAGYLQNAHFGFSGYFREFMFHNLLAQEGYVVMDMDYRGSKGYGRDWRTAVYRNMGHPEVEDLADGVTWMATNANVDVQRVGTYGGSYGGFLTFMALFTEPDLFQAGAALRPVTDWAHYNAPYTSNILNTPDVDAIAFERSSPIEHAQGLTKPLLIMSGVLDDNVFFQDSVRLVQRLIELEKPMFETAIYPVEPHGFRQPSSWLDEYRRIYKLFEQELK